MGGIDHLLFGYIDGAEACFAEAVALSEAMGTQAGTIARINQGILALQRGRPDRARPLLEAAVEDLVAQERATMELATRFWMVACLDGPDREACLSRISSLLDRSPGRDPDVQEAADFAMQAGGDTGELERLVARLQSPKS